MRKTAKKPHTRSDGWVNATTGIGNALRDKRLAATFEADLLPRDVLEQIWRGDDMAARVVEKIPDEMLREGYEVLIDDSKKDSETVHARVDELEFNSKLKTALEYERAYGGAALLLGADDGALKLSDPLNLDRIKSLKWVNALEPSELTPIRWYTNPAAPKYGEVEIWRIQRQGVVGVIPANQVNNVEVHESRLIMFTGVRVSKRQVAAANGWGDSVLVRCNRVLADFHQSWGSASILLQDFSQAVFKMADLAELIASNNDDVVVKRMTAIDMSRSVARAVMIDTNEEFERKTTSVTGLPEMLEKFCLRLAAAVEMPVTLLMGQSPAGLNATGDSDIRFFYDRIKARQRDKLKPAINRFLTVLFRSLDGPTKGKEPKNWSVAFNPLWQMTDLQTADLRLKTAQTDAVYITNGVLTAEEVSVSRFGGDEFSIETTVDFESRDAMAEVEPAPVESTSENKQTLPASDPKAEEKPGQKPAPGAPVDPNADPSKPTLAEAVDPTTALNGAQVTALLEIVKSVAAEEIPRESGVAMIAAAFPLTLEQAEKVMSTVGNGFKPKPPEPKIVAAPPGAKPGAPAPKAPPNGEK